MTQNKHLVKSNEKLSKAEDGVLNQSKRLQASISELEALNQSIEKVKSDMSKLSYDDQEAKLADIDKMLVKKNALQLRVEFLSGPNKEIIDDLISAAKVYQDENAALDKQEADIELNNKKLEKDYEAAKEANRLKVDEIRNARYEYKQRVHGLLSKTPLSDIERVKFCKEHKLPFRIIQR